MMDWVDEMGIRIKSGGWMMRFGDDDDDYDDDGRRARGLAHLSGLGASAVPTCVPAPVRQCQRAE